MNDKKPSVEELKAVAESAIAARQQATAAKKAADDAGGVDEQLNQAAAEADTQAKEAEQKAVDLQALSQKTPDPKKVDKLLRKRGYIDRELKELGVNDDEEDDDEDDEDEDGADKPVTRGELAENKMRDLLGGLTDQDDRRSVEAALAAISPTLKLSDPQQAFNNAVAIANRDRNAKIIEEHNRKGGKGAVIKNHGAGAPPKQDEEVFEPTALERSYMRPPFSLTEAEIKAARGSGQKLG